MAIFENLFGEFIDGALGLPATEAKELGATYIVIGGHSIGGWILLGSVAAFIITCCVSKKFRSRFF